MPKNLRFFTAYLIHYIKKYFIVVILGIIFGSLIYIKRNLVFQIYSSLATSRSDIGIEGIYTIETLPTFILNQLSEGFTYTSENDKTSLSSIISDLDIQNNNQDYTFTFQDNLTWQNGKKFKTSDININIPQTKIEPISKNVLKISTPESFSPLLSILSKPIFLKDTLIGLGQYKVDNLTYQDGHIKLLRLISTTDNQKINYHFYPNSLDLLNAFKLGEVTEITTNSIDDQLNEWPKIKITPSISTSQYLAIFLNTEKINSKQNRQAIAYATPKSDDKNKRCLGPISPNSWAYNPQIKQYNYNPTRSKELLEKDSLAEINITVTDRKLLTQAEIIKKSWEEVLKLKVNLTISNGPVDLNSYDALLAYWPIPSDPDQYSLWHSTQSGTNITHLNNSRIDKLLEEGRRTQDQQERKKIYIDFQKFLLEESPAIFLEFPTTYTISRVK